MLGTSCLGTLGHGRHGRAGLIGPRQGFARRGAARQARLGSVGVSRRSGDRVARHGRLGYAGRDGSCLGGQGIVGRGWQFEASRASAWPGWRGKERSGASRHRKSGQGRARCGLARQAWPVGVRLGTVGVVWHVFAGLGAVRFGRAGMAPHRRHGMSREASHGRHGWSGLSGSSRCWSPLATARNGEAGRVWHGGA